MALKDVYYNGEPVTLDGRTLKVDDQGLPEQEVTATITENGTTEITPDEGKTMSKATVTVNVPTGDGDTLNARLTNTLTSYSNAEIEAVQSYGFAGCSELETISLSAVKTLRAYAFYACSKLQTIDFPLLQSIEAQAFRNCSKITDFITNEHFNSRIDASTFEGCTALAKADFYHITTLGIGAYGLACTNLETLIIRNTDAVPPLYVTGFGAATTKINAGTGYVYVPSAMVDAYKAATNWAKYADQIRAIEDYPDITGG